MGAPGGLPGGNQSTLVHESAELTTQKFGMRGRAAQLDAEMQNCDPKT